MRVFVAVELAPTAQQAIGAFVTCLRRHAVFAGTSVKWVPTSNLHITLRFLGEVPASELAHVGAVVESPFCQSAFQVTVDAYGLFPSRGAPRVVWLGARGGLSQLSTLHDEVEGRLKESGFAVAARPFRPHVTIGRVTRTWDMRTPARSARSSRRSPLAVPRWLVGRVVLYESRLSSRGSTYRRPDERAARVAAWVNRSPRAPPTRVRHTSVDRP